MFEINLFSTQLPLSQILKMTVMPLSEEGKIQWKVTTLIIDNGQNMFSFEKKLSRGLVNMLLGTPPDLERGPLWK